MIFKLTYPKRRHCRSFWKKKVSCKLTLSFWNRASLFAKEILYSILRRVIMKEKGVWMMQTQYMWVVANAVRPTLQIIDYWRVATICAKNACVLSSPNMLRKYISLFPVNLIKLRQCITKTLLIKTSKTFGSQAAAIILRNKRAVTSMLH